MTEARSAWFKRTDYDRSDSATRTRLLEAAESVFVDAGYAKASIARITEVAGVSRATFYVYFQSRDEIFVSLAESVVEAAEKAQRAPRADHRDPRAVIAHAIDSALELYSSRSGFVRLIEMRAGEDERVAQIWDRLWKGQIDRGARFIERLQEQGACDPAVEPGMAAEAMTAVLLHHGRRLGTRPEGRRELVASLSRLYERVIALHA
ncbi:TetR/AcrR family transcriptional regulator [Rhodococcus sp. C26F]